MSHTEHVIESRDKEISLRDITLLFAVVCIFLVTPPLVISQRQTSLQTDFVYFYSLGRIANEHPAEQLYDYSFQQKTFQEVRALPAANGVVYGPSPYPPFVSLLFRPFAHLTFWTAQRIWQWCTLTLFLSGVILLLRCFYSKQRWQQFLVVAAVLSFYPFIVETFLNAQLAAIGFFAFALAIWAQEKHRSFLVGLALSGCLYKPPLLILGIPMLLIRRQWRALLGFITGAGLLIGGTTLMFGPRVWPAYLRMLMSLRSMQPRRNFSMYVDLLAFWSSLVSAHAWVRDIAVVLSCLVLGYFLLRAWLSSAGMLSIWAATLTCSLVLNVYMATYDTIILIPGAIATARYFPPAAYRWFMATVLVVLISSWFAQPLARATGVQILTIALVLLCSLQIWGCFILDVKRRAALKDPDPHNGIMVDS